MGMENEYDVAERVEKQLKRDREKFDEGYRVGYREGYNKAKDESKLRKEEKGDLISRDALKEELKQYFSDGVLDSVSAKLALNMILRKINEAPSVEGFTKEDMSGAYSEGYACGSRENERPQGEWIIKTISTFPQYQPDEYICPFCNTIVNYKTKFCENCGADMRKARKTNEDKQP